MSEDVRRRSARLAAYLVLALSFLAGANAAHAQSLISRTIVVNGTMTDWTSPTSIPANAGQHSTDCEEDQACEADDIQSTGRDLRHFAYTWDNSYLYFFVERYASASNTNTWLFYLDENVNGKMQSGERVFAVDWQGNNRSTDANLCVYVQSSAGGDTIRGDGFTMPGSVNNCQSIYTGITGGSLSGLQMESRLSWAQLGRSGPTNTAFHISSSRGYNLPSHVEDNMGGPGGSGGGGGQLFPPDLAVSITAGAADVANQEVITLTGTLTNIYYDNYTGVAVNVSLPPQVTYVSHSATGGATFTDTNSDGIPDRWNIGAVGPQGTFQLQVQVRGTRLPIAAAVTSGLTLHAYTGTDTQAGNNTSSVGFTVLPSPEIILSKTASQPAPLPGTVLTYTVLATNAAHAQAQQVVLESEIDPTLEFGLDSFGAGVPFQFLNGSPSSGLTLGTPEYSNDGGVTWSYVPVSGGGGAPAGYDGTVTNWRIVMNGTMATHGALFEVRYTARVR